MNPALKILSGYFKYRYLLPFKSRAHLEAYQNKKLKEFFKWVLPRSQFYRELYSGKEELPISELPIINKKIMMENFDQLNTQGLKRNEAMTLALENEARGGVGRDLHGFYVGLSTGTSGERGLFAVSPEEHLQYVAYVLAKVRQNSIFRKNRVAIFLRANNLLYRAPIGKRFQYLFFDSSQDPSSWIHSLSEFSPTVIIAPPSVLRVLAQMNLRRPFSKKLNEIVSVAEVLDPIDQNFIEGVFEMPLHQYYQCTEGLLGITCLHGRIHLNEDIIHFDREYLPGSKSHFIPIMSDFTRRTQPLLRYRLDDVLVEAQNPCPCGSLFTGLERIEGREADIFWLPEHRSEKLQPVFADVLIRILFKTLEQQELQDYRIEQKDVLHWIVHISPNPTPLTQTKIIGALNQYLVSRALKTPQIQIHPLDNILLTNERQKKLRRVVRSFRIGQNSQRS